MLEADRQPQEILRSTGARALDRRAMLDEALRPPEARRPREDAELRRDFHRARPVAANLHREHPAERRHLTARDVVGRMRREPRVMDRLDAWVAVQERG